MIRPYYLNDGIPSLADSEILKLWELLVAHNRPMVQDFPDAQAFVATMKEWKVSILGDYEGMVYLTQSTPASAEFHFQGFCHGERAVELGKLFAAQALTIFETIYGYVPVSNVKACLYTEAIGGTLVGTVPGKGWSETKKSHDVNLYYWRR